MIKDNGVCGGSLVPRALSGKASLEMRHLRSGDKRLQSWEVKGTAFQAEEMANSKSLSQQ